MKARAESLDPANLFVSSPISANAFCDHVNARYLQEPAALLRSGDLGKISRTEIAVRSSRSRAATKAIVGDSINSVYLRHQVQNTAACGAKMQGA